MSKTGQSNELKRIYLCNTLKIVARQGIHVIFLDVGEYSKILQTWSAEKCVSV